MCGLLMSCEIKLYLIKYFFVKSHFRLKYKYEVFSYVNYHSTQLPKNSVDILTITGYIDCADSENDLTLTE